MPPSSDVSNRPAFAISEDLTAHALDTAQVMQAELAVAESRESRAMLQHEVAEADERVRGDELAAARGYLAAFNLLPTFRAPLDALIRLYTRRKSVNNLIKLYDALVKAAPTARDRAEALTLRGELLEDKLMVDRGARAAYELAVEADPGCRVAWLDLERDALRTGDRELVVRVLTHLAALTNDPGRKSHLLLELAQEHTLRDAPEGVGLAAQCLRDAASLPLGRWRSLTELERFAEKYDRPHDLVYALEGRAELAQRVAAGQGFEGGSGTFAISRLEDAELASEESASLWFRAARVRLTRLEDPDGARGAMDQALALKPDARYRYFAMILADQANDIDRASQHAAWLLSQNVGDRYLRASMHFRVAETAALNGEVGAATQSLRAALDENPESAAALSALIEQLVATGEGAMAVHEFDRLSESATDDATRAALRRAAGFYSLALRRDDEGAMQRFRMACESDPADVVSRRALVTLLGRRSATASTETSRARVTAIDDLLGLVVDDDEREALLLEKFSAQRYELRDARGAATTAEQLVECTREALWSLEAAAVMWSAAGEMEHAARWAEALGERDDLPHGEADTAAWRAVAARWAWSAGDSARARELAVLGHRGAPADAYLAAMAQGLCFEARDHALAYDVTARHAEALEDGEGTRWLLLASLRFEHQGAPEFSRKALEAAIARAPGSSAVRAAVMAATRWRGDVAVRAVVTEAGIDAEDCGPEELALGIELALVRAFVEHDVSGAVALIDQVAACDGGNSTAVSMLNAIARGANEGPDAESTIDALQAVLSTVASSDPLRVGIELEVARALGATQSTRDQAVAARELVDEDQPELAAPRLLALLDAVQREGREDVPAALGRVAALGEGETADALRAAAITALAGLGRTAQARALSDAHPTLAASVIAGAEHPAGIDRAAVYAERLEARYGLSGGASGPADARASASWASVGGMDAEALARAEQLLSRNGGDLVALDVKRVSGRRVKAWRAVIEACAALGERVASPERSSAYFEEAGVVAAEEIRDGAEAERYLRASLAASPGRDIAYRKLREILDGRKDTAALEALVTTRVATVREPSVRAELYWEQSRLRRALGLREQALESALRVVALAPGHVAAYALIAEVHAASGRLAETAEALVAMAGCSETPPAQRRAARLGAVDVFDLRLSRPHDALAQMDALFVEGDADDALIERAVRLAERSGLWAEALRFSRRAVERARGDGPRAAAMLRVAHLYRDRVQDATGAREYALQAHGAFPANLEVLRTLQGLSDGEQRAKQAKRTADALREALRTGEVTSALVLGIAEAAHSGGDGVLERAAQRLAGVLGAPLERLPAMSDPSGATLRDPALMLRYRHPADAGRAVTLLETVMPDLVELSGLSTDAFKVGRSDRIKGVHPTRTALAPFLALVGSTEFDLYVGGLDAGRIAVIPGDPVTVVLGRGVAIPLSPDARYELVRRLLLSVRAVAPLAVLSADAAAAHALAALVYADHPLASGTERIEALLKPVARAVSRRVRRSLAESGRVIAAAPDAWSELSRAARGATATARRGALVVSGAVGAAFLDLAREEGLSGQSMQVLLARSAAARELALFAVSDALAQVERECGVDRR